VSHWYHQRGAATGTRARTRRVYPVAAPSTPLAVRAVAATALSDDPGPAGRFAGWLTELAAASYPSLPFVRGCATPRVPCRCHAACRALQTATSRLYEMLFPPSGQSRRASTASASAVASPATNASPLPSRFLHSPRRRRVSTRGLADRRGAVIERDAGGPESESWRRSGRSGDDYRRS